MNSGQVIFVYQLQADIFNDNNSRQLDSVGDVASVTCKANTWQLTTVGKCTDNNNTESSLKMETAGTAASVNDRSGNLEKTAVNKIKTDLGGSNTL